MAILRQGVKHESRDPAITQLLFFLQWVITKCLGEGRLDIVLGAKNQYVIETKPDCPEELEVPGEEEPV